MASFIAVIRYALLETFFCIPILPKTAGRVEVKMSIYYSIAKNNVQYVIEVLHNLASNIDLKEKNCEIVTAVVNAIHSIVDYYERIDKSSLFDEEDLQFKAFSYLNNQIKHDTKLEIIHYPVCGSMYPMSFPMRFGPPGVCWNRFEDNGSKKARGKREHFESCLCDKDVERTLGTMLEIIEKTHARIGEQHTLEETM